MKQLYVFCEGQTEQAFCTRVLQPHFFPNHDGVVHPIRIAHKRRKGVVHRGGVNKYQIIRDDMVRTFRAHQRSCVLFTSLIDLYALPNDFPGKAGTTRNPDNPRRYVEALEKALTEDVDEPRFISHLQLHEFETLIFSEPESLRLSYDDIEKEVGELQRVAADFVDIEKINDTPTGAPSKRIIQLVPRYEHDKSTVGPDVTEYIGMRKMMAACAHFRDWINCVVQRLESG